MRSARPAPPTPRLMREQIAPLAAAFTLAAAKDLPEGSLHVGRLHDLLDDIPNPAHKLLFIAFNTGPFNPPGPASSNRFRPTKPYPTLYFSVFRPLRTAVTAACPPPAPRWGQVPGVVRRLKFPFDCCSDETDVRVRIRGIVVRIRHRNTAIRVRVVVATIDHTAYGEAPPFKCKSTIFKLLFNKQIQNLTSKKYFSTG